MKKNAIRDFGVFEDYTMRKRIERENLIYLGKNKK